MGSISKILNLKGDQEYLKISPDMVIEGGGKYNNFEYLIVFIETHRTGYICFPKEYDYSRFVKSIDCHGGIT